MKLRRLVLAGLLVAYGCGPAISSAPPGAPASVQRAGGAGTDSPLVQLPSDGTGGTTTAPPLPPVPGVYGAKLAIRVVYPAEGQLITARDSNFLHGSVGSGDAELWVNGDRVSVAPNGAFLAWLPVPPGERPQYTLLARRGDDSASHVLTVRVPALRPALSATGVLHVDSSTVAPSIRQKLRVRSSEPVRVSVRAPANAAVWVESVRNGFRQPLVPLTDTRLATRSAAAGAGNPVVRNAGVADGGVSDPAGDAVRDVGTVFQTEVKAAQLALGSRLSVARGTDTVRFPLLQPELSDTGMAVVGVLRNASTVVSDTDRVVIGRPIADGTYKWLLLSGTVVEITGEQGAFTRVRLTANLDIWVNSADIVVLPAGTAVPRRVTGGFRVSPSESWTDVVIATGERPAFYVEEGDRTLTLTLYDTQASPEISPILANDTLIRRISWIQEETDRLRITFALSQPVYGWLSMWDEARRAFVLRVRRVPKVNAMRPLEGQTVVVDAGHPPAGATGPTGLYEGDAVLPVAEKVAELLAERGAMPVMTRTTLAPFGLVERTVIARRADANAFVSIHLNALPDGVNPFTNNGTSTLFFHQNSEPLARYTQQALMKRFPLRDLGVHYQNLAVARPTWYPSVLAEGLFIMLPEQEAAIRNPAFQKLYAEALVEGLEKYFLELAGK